MKLSICKVYFDLFLENVKYFGAVNEDASKDSEDSSQNENIYAFDSVNSCQMPLLEKRACNFPYELTNKKLSAFKILVL